MKEEIEEIKTGFTWLSDSMNKQRAIFEGKMLKIME